MKNNKENKLFYPKKKGRDNLLSITNIYSVMYNRIISSDLTKPLSEYKKILKSAKGIIKYCSKIGLIKNTPCINGKYEGPFFYEFIGGNFKEKDDNEGKRDKTIESCLFREAKEEGGINKKCISESKFLGRTEREINEKQCKITFLYEVNIREGFVFKSQSSYENSGSKLDITWFDTLDDAIKEVTEKTNTNPNPKSKRCLEQLIYYKTIRDESVKV